MWADGLRAGLGFWEPRGPGIELELVESPENQGHCPSNNWATTLESTRLTKPLDYDWLVKNILVQPRT